MTPDRRAELIAVTEEIQADLKADIEWLEGKPLVGTIVAEAFGRLGGTVSALAELVGATLKEDV